MRFEKKNNSFYFECVQQYLKSNITVRELCKKMQISERTFFRYLSSYRKNNKIMKKAINEHNKNYNNEKINKMHNNEQKIVGGNSKHANETSEKNINIVSINDDIKNLQKFNI